MLGRQKQTDRDKEVKWENDKERPNQKNDRVIRRQNHTWFVNGVRDEILPELCIVLIFGKLYGLVHVLQLLHDHLQRSSAVPHPAWEPTCWISFLVIILKTHLK